jgi:hypothetical protein
MRDMSDPASTIVSRVIDAPQEALYWAFLDRGALERPEDNEAGCRSSLGKLASFVGG